MKSPITLLKRCPVVLASILLSPALASSGVARAACTTQGNACTSSADCCGPNLACATSGKCELETFTGTCTTGTDCLSGNCVGGQCLPGTSPGPCVSNEDCGLDNLYQLECRGGASSFPVGGHPCNPNSDCMSQDCVLGVPNTCSCSARGAFCGTTADCCNATDECADGRCKLPHGATCSAGADCASGTCNGALQCAGSALNGDCGNNNDCTPVNANSECVHNAKCALNQGAVCTAGQLCVEDLPSLAAGTTCVSGHCSNATPQFNWCNSLSDCKLSSQTCATSENFGWRDGYCMTETQPGTNACASNVICVSDNCSAGDCAAGGLYTSCLSSSDCTPTTTYGCDQFQNLCLTEKGKACTAGYQCLSGTCTGGTTCACSGSGSPCAFSTDCCSGSCTSGHC